MSTFNKFQRALRARQAGREYLERMWGISEVIDVTVNTLVRSLIATREIGENEALAVRLSFGSS